MAAGTDGCYDIASLADALAGKGHDVRVYTAAPSCSVLTGGDFEVIPMPVEPAVGRPPAALMPSIGDIGRLLVDDWTHRPPDVAHSQGWAYGMASQLAANRVPVPTVQAFNGLATLTGQPGHQQETPETAVKVQNLLAKNATTIAAACADDLSELIRLGCPRAKISVLPAGVTVDEDSAGEPRSPRPDGQHQVVAVASGPARTDRLAEVVRAMSVLPHGRLRILERVGGERRTAGRLRDLAAGLGVGDHCEVVPVADEAELSAELRSADVVVCPDSYDSYGTIALQAMASGAAVIAAAAGGIRDAVIPDVTGVLVPPANVDALRRALRSVLGQQVLREGMGLAGRSRARSRYSWDRIAVDAESAYRAAAEQHSTAARPAMV
ncbi:MAG: glycosyltransferase family 4 protein [Actinomycetota bacterium]|nr:glycosyltransferase family 4 protein [Actinomycetota bacterium]